MKNLFITASVLLLLVSCAPKTMVVLVPDDDDMVGQIKISTPKDEVVINEPNQFVQARDRMSSVREMDEKRIDKIFGDALSALPPRPDILIKVWSFESYPDLLTDDP
jgi:OmpA-OmpF porin, OOP family